MKISESELKNITYNEAGLVPAIAQDAATGEVLMMAWMNEEALRLTLERGQATYYSRSRSSLWLKGETSGNLQRVEELLYDCDGDTVLLKVTPEGPACHTGERSCFFRTLTSQEPDDSDSKGRASVDDQTPRAPKTPKSKDPIRDLFQTIVERRGASPESSYVASLYSRGLNKIAEKIEEETGELIEAARIKEDKDTVYELCDLWFHSMVLLGHKGIDIDEVYRELLRRRGTSGLVEKAGREDK